MIQSIILNEKSTSFVYFLTMTIPPNDPNRQQNIVFHSMFPSEYVGPALVREDATAAPAKLPTINAFEIGEEYTSVLLRKLVRDFENEFAIHYQNNPTYLELVRQRFEQAWKYEENYKQFIKIFGGWVDRGTEKYGQLLTKRNIITIPFYPYSQPSDPPAILSDEQKQSVASLTAQIDHQAEQMNVYINIINNAKAALYLIHQTRAIVGNYEPADRQHTTKTTNDPPPTSPPPASEKPVSGPGFDTYIVEKHRAKLMPYLTQYYIGLRPRFYAYMIGALIKLEVTPESTRHSNKSAVHRALKESFRVTFSPQSWNTAINRLDPDNIDEDRRQIENDYQRIKNYLLNDVTHTEQVV